MRSWKRYAGVYPRVYGGTHHPENLGASDTGLSPRVRGNRANSAGRSSLGRSIPACTGEPRLATFQSFSIQVYPRVYGGTFDFPGQLGPDRGLSPRVRGNRRCPFGPYFIGRSIPACTGEPHPQDGQLAQVGVYPRVYGGTGHGEFPMQRGYGLSPRVRGNLQRHAGVRHQYGSIPACTGEPVMVSFLCNVATVYPRVYGGTSCVVSIAVPIRGLSPRVRGNHRCGARADDLSGSIPACTGEPLLILLHFLPLRAYCALQRDAIQIVKELFVPGRTGSFRENDALLIHQLNGRRPQNSNDLSARMTRVLPRHDDGPSPKLQEPFLDHRPDPFSDTRGESRRGVYSRSNLQHARGKKATDARSNITSYDYRHRRQSAALSCRSFSR